MYFEQDDILKDDKIEIGSKLIKSLSGKDKEKYLKELFFYLRQQAFYAGLDSLEVCKLFKSLGDYEKSKILEFIGDLKDDEDELPDNVKIIKCSGTKEDFEKLKKVLDNYKDKSEENINKSDLN